MATLEGYGFRDPTPAVGAAAALLEYARDQKQSALSHLLGLERLQPAGFLILDDASLRGLEVLESLTGMRESTLLSVLDTTRTAAGGRRLRAALARPYRDPEPANARLDRVGELSQDAPARDRIGRALEEMADIERILARVHCERATPRDLGGLRRTLLAAPKVEAGLAELSSWAGLRASLVAEPLASELDAALVDSPPVNLAEGGVFRDGYDSDLDTIRETAHGGRRWMAELEAREREATGIANLKIGVQPGLRLHDRGDALATLQGAGALHAQADPLDGRTLRHARAEGTRGEDPRRGGGAAKARDRSLRGPLPEGHRGDGSPAVARRDPRGMRSLPLVRRLRGRPRVRPADPRPLGHPFDRGGASSRCRARGRHRFLRAERPRPRRRGTPGRDPDRAQYGGKIDLPAPDRVDRPHGAGRFVRAGARRPDRRRRSDLHPRRGARRDRAGAVDLPRGDDRDEQHPPPRDRRRAWC